MASYVNNTEKAENNRSSAYTLLIVGIAGFILVVLYFLDVIPVRGLNKYMISGVMGALFLLFIIMGCVSLRSARIFEKKAGSENNLTSEIKKWCMTNLSAKAIDESLHFDQEEEERRLFFVGITRARNHLELSYYTNPGEPGVLGSYSNYLKMIPEELLEWKEIRSDEEKRTNLKELTRRAKEEIRKAEAQKAENVQEQKAIHLKYGTGIVTSEDDMMVEVEFPNYGKKQFIKAFQEVEMIR